MKPGPFSSDRRQPAAQRVERASLKDRLLNYLTQHGQTLVASLGRIYRAPLGTAMTVMVIAIALTLPVSFMLMVDNARAIGGSLESTNRISLFLKPELGNEAGRKLADKLAANPRIGEAKLITKEAGLLELREYSGFGEVLKALDSNPLPVVVAIQPKDSLSRPEDVEQLLAELRALPESGIVQSDMEWLRKLHTMLNIVARGTLLLGSLLGLAILFIIGNTVRLDLQHRREEIAVARLMGATNGFIRRPFLYTGFWYGLFGGVLAWVLSTVFVLLLRGPTRQLAALYGARFDLEFLGAADSGKLILLAISLGILSALSVVTHYLARFDLEGTSQIG